MPLQVIGAGFPRTGTLSLKSALERLGYGRCHHMREVFDAPRLQRLWEGAFAGEPTDWDDVFRDFGATVDAPACYVFDRLAAHYPQAKVVLTVRDPDKWYDSMRSTILSDGYIDTLMPTSLGPMLMKMLPFAAGQGAGHSGPPDLSRVAMSAAHQAHVERVRRTIPPERLLVYRVSEGWEPLCRFLGRPIPDQPFPNINDRESFHATFTPASVVSA
jgi:hypothetical protein